MRKLETKEIIVNDIDNKEMQYVIIWLHGLGADYNDFVPIVKELELPYSCKFIFPNAPIRSVTINNNMKMRAWYDIKSVTNIDIELVDFAGIKESTKEIEKLIIVHKQNGYDTKKIIIAGFSQGGVIAFHTLFNSSYELNGVIALSCYLPLDNNNILLNNVNNNHAHIFCAHGYYDNIVPYEAASQAVKLLRANNFKVDFKSYDVAHTLCDDELYDLNNWLRGRDD